MAASIMAPASDRSSVVSERSTCRIRGKLRDSRLSRQMAFALREAASRRLSRTAVRRRVPLRGRRRRLTMDYLTGLKAEAERRVGPARAEELKEKLEDKAAGMG